MPKVGIAKPAYLRTVIAKTFAIFTGSIVKIVSINNFAKMRRIFISSIPMKASDFRFTYWIFFRDIPFEAR